ncbi:hypothetical protein K2X05_10420 [bacterium]|nr:hypothetical protein [bacterium]
MKCIFITSFVLLIVFKVDAGQWALRARENYEFIKTSESKQSFSGFSSTIQFGYEEPFKYSYALGLNPALSKFADDKEVSTGVLGKEIKVYQIGSDIKYFPLEDTNGFIRNTLFYSLIDTKTNVDHIGGYGLSVSAGWEFWLYDLFSLAPEIGYKHTRLRTDESLNTVFLSLGVHFYKLKVN